MDPWTSVKDAPKLSQFPVGGMRWTTLLEGIRVGDEALELQSTVRGTPSGRMVALLDTGDPTAVLPSPLVDEIYSRIPGAVPFVQEEGKVWVVPCNTTTVVSFQFG